MRNPITWISPEVIGNKHSKYSKFLKLLSVFPSKPKSTPVLRIDNKYIFNELDHINQLRNRIAHHEPICFASGLPVKSPSAYWHTLLLTTVWSEGGKRGRPTKPKVEKQGFVDTSQLFTSKFEAKRIL